MLFDRSPSFPGSFPASSRFGTVSRAAGAQSGGGAFTCHALAAAIARTTSTTTTAQNATIGTA